jgi:hypothetical protein
MQTTPTLVMVLVVVLTRAPEVGCHALRPAGAAEFIAAQMKSVRRKTPPDDSAAGGET